nr:phosphatidylglycerol lysyltransferase domain-containing protein [Tropicibacter sp. R15_0]
MGGTPGGVGPFELALLALIPSSDVAGLAAALIAFRLVYYVIPCIAGLTYAALGRVKAPDLDIVQPLVQQGPRAEHAIARQSRTQGLREKTAEAELLETPQTLALFLGPSRGQIAELLKPLRRQAFAENRHACLYKVTAQDAVQARKNGWTVTAIAQEAVIDTRSYSTTGPERRQLRRFLRKASKAKVVFAPIEAPDWPVLHAIHKEWEEKHGQERGLTMGRFCPLYLRDKPLFGAYQNGVLIGFTSGLSAPGVLSLDLMRHRSDIPNGTMHGLIDHMITWAQERGIEEVCLAAVPHPHLTRLLRLPPGLTRFKASFAPRWRPLYMAAPNKMALIICALDILRTVLRPPAIPYTTAERWQVDALITGETAPVPRQTKLRETG